MRNPIEKQLADYVRHLNRELARLDRQIERSAEGGAVAEARRLQREYDKVTKSMDRLDVIVGGLTRADESSYV